MEDTCREPGATREERKRRAAERAADLVESGMTVGLGAGTTAAYVLEPLAHRVRVGALRDLTCVPCSIEVGDQARSLGLSVVTLADRPCIDLTIDGADEVDPALDLIKGRGGALLHEKMVAQASRHEVIVVDDSKLSPVLGTLVPVPLEVFAFGWRAEERFARELGGEPRLRTTRGEPRRTDEGNFILDCTFGPIANAAAVAARLDARAGIAGHGLFIGLATDVLVGVEEGVRHLRREERTS